MTGGAASSLGLRHPLGVRLARYAPLMLLTILVAFLLLWPVAMLLYGIFRSEPPGQAGAWTLSPLREAYGTGSTYKALLNSVIFTVTTTALATLIGACLAFVSTRTTVPLRRVVTPVMLLVLALPHLLYAASWDLLANPAVGVLNAPFKSLFDSAPLKAASWPGLIFVQSLKASAFCYFMLLGPFSTMNRSYEDASLTSGATRLRTLFAIDLPILAPAIFGVVVILAVFGLGAFDIPQILGGPAEIQVLSTRIYHFVVGLTPPRYAEASALALPMLLALVVLIVVQWRVTGKRSFVTVTGKSYTAARWDLGRKGYWITAGIVLFTIVALVLPGGQVILTSFQRGFGLGGDLTLSNFDAVLTNPQTARAFRLTLWLAIGGGLVAMAIGTLLAYVGRRAARGMGRTFDVLMLAPIIMPGVVLAVGLLWGYLALPGLRSLYGTIWLCFIGMVVVLMPVAGAAGAGSVAQIGRELEEAAHTAGASGSRVAIQIVLPLLAKSFIAGWLVCGVIMGGMLDVPLMLLPATDSNVAVVAYDLMYSAGLPTQASALLVLWMLMIAAAGVVYVLWVHVIWRLGVAAAARARTRRSRHELAGAVLSDHATAKEE